jgi:hypothetical protein
MDFDYLRAVSLIQRLLPSSESPGEKMNTLLDDCATAFPHQSWARFRELPFDEDAARVFVWFLAQLSRCPPATGLHAVWFGLFNPIDAVRGVVTDLDVVGLSAPVGEDPFGWATSPDWAPDCGRARSEVLASIYDLAYSNDDELGNAAEYTLALGFVTFGLARGFREHRWSPALSNDLLVAGGFNDGDGLVIGVATNRGFAAAPYAG